MENHPYFPIPKEELSPDLEWMLSSTEVPVDILAGALVQESYLEIYRLLSIFTQDPDEAAFLSIATLVNAINRRYHYPVGTAVRLWLLRLAFDELLEAREGTGPTRLYRQILRRFTRREYPGEIMGGDLIDRVWGALNGLPTRVRLALLLNSILGLPEGDIAIVQQRKAQGARERLEAARRQLVFRLSAEDWATASEQGFDQVLQQAVARYCPVPEFTSADLEEISGEVTRQSQQAGAQETRVSSFKEISWLAAAILGFTLLLWGGSRFLPDEPDAVPKPVIVTVIVTPVPQQTPEYLPVHTFLYFPYPGDTLASIAEQMGMSVEALARLNGISLSATPEPGLGLKVSIPQELFTSAQPTPFPTLEANTPLTYPASGVVRQVMESSRTNWHTLWADAQAIEYGPQGYSGFPQVTRLQLWYSQPEQFLSLVGDLRSPQWVEKRNGDLFFFVPRSGWEEIASVGKYNLTTDTNPLKFLYAPEAMPWMAGGRFSLHGDSQAAGRKAAIVDWRDEQGQRRYRLWVDVRTGLVLRVQEYTGEDWNILLKETILTRLALDQEFPAGTYNPDHKWNWAYALSPSEVALPGTNLPAPEVQALAVEMPAEGRPLKRLLLPPASFDITSAPLSFQYPLLSQEELWQSSLSWPDVFLFAGQYYVTTLEMGDPFAMACDRSQNGQYLAYSFDRRMPGAFQLRPEQLTWLDLNEPKNVHTLETDFESGIIDIAFHPDSHQLAIGGFQLIGDETGIYLLDLESGELDLFKSLGNLYRIFWKPDGTQIGWVGSPTDDWAHIELVIADVATGETVYQQPLNAYRLEIPADAPLFDWGYSEVFYPNGMERCTRLPLPEGDQEK